jgi:hypothetical protein
MSSKLPQVLLKIYDPEYSPGSCAFNFSHGSVQVLALLQFSHELWFDMRSFNNLRLASKNTETTGKVQRIRAFSSESEHVLISRFAYPSCIDCPATFESSQHDYL